MFVRFGSRAIENRNSELEEIEAQIKQARKVQSLVAKTSVCHFCLAEKMKYQRKNENVKFGDYSFDLGSFKLNVCSEHIVELRDSLDELIEKDKLR